jgi:tRNA(Ile)-lysidine synthetase-like protein
MESIIDYWFPDKTIQYHSFWFSHNKDDEIRDKFLSFLLKARNHEFKCETYEEKLAHIILFDQMSRNIFRTDREINRTHIDGTKDDDIALKISLKLLECDIVYREDHLIFICLPLRHSRKYELCCKVIDIIHKYEKLELITNVELWLKFKIASYRSFFEHEYVIPKKKFHIENFVDNISKYSHVFDVDVKLSNWTIDASLDEPLILTIEKSLLNYSYDGNIIVSLSGGVDSMVILHALSNLKKKYKFTLVALHIEYINREQAYYESRAVEIYAHELDVDYYTIKNEHIMRPETSRKDLTEKEIYYKSCTRKLFEDETRNIRFNFYKALCNKYSSHVVALGHHNDDLIENVIANVIKGRDISDLSVLDEFDIQDEAPLWRPLLSHPKKDILTYAEKHGIPYMYNSTPPLCMRGRMRNELIPLIEDIFPSMKSGLRNIAEQSIQLSKYFNEKIIKSILTTFNVGKLGFYFNVELIKNAPYNVWLSTFAQIFHSMKLTMIKKKCFDILYENINKSLEISFMAYDNHIAHYSPETNIIIFLNMKHFIHENHEIKDVPFENKFTTTTITLSHNPSHIPIKSSITELINGKIKYTIDDIDISYNNIVTKNNKKYFKSMFNLPMSILNRFPWIYSSNISSHSVIVEINYFID